jgi:hypothetical protein
MRRAYFLSAMLFTGVLCLSAIGVAAAEPQKNQIVVDASCEPNGQIYTFVINGMSKTGHVTNNTDVNVSNVKNVVVKQFTVDYIDEHGTPGDPRDDVRVGGDEYVNPVTESDKKKGFKGDLIQCSGVAKDIELQGLGLVTAIYDFQAFVTPRGGA